MKFLVVFLGAGLGGMARHAINIASLRLFGSGFPSGTFIVNVLGSLMMGLIVEYLALKSDWPQAVRLLLTTGFLGGFTTFSTFSLDTVSIWERSETWLAAGYAAASVCLSIAALFFGLAIVRSLVAVHP